mmetsp:Transcript_18313/g.57608  ORF Transcript_18313/g.57608 Transcript_18313/m.57608 type:complete len:228 (-) Transcript_18313:15-698(-)
MPPIGLVVLLEGLVDFVDAPLYAATNGAKPIVLGVVVELVVLDLGARDVPGAEASGAVAQENVVVVRRLELAAFAAADGFHVHGAVVVVARHLAIQRIHFDQDATNLRFRRGEPRRRRRDFPLGSNLHAAMAVRFVVVARVGLDVEPRRLRLGELGIHLALVCEPHGGRLGLATLPIVFFPTPPLPRRRRPREPLEGAVLRPVQAHRDAPPLLAHRARDDDDVLTVV